MARKMNYSARLPFTTEQVYEALQTRDYWDAIVEEMRKYSPNELISLVKNSSLLSVIAVYELTRAGQAIITTYFVPFEIYALIAIYYYAIVSALAFLSRYFERKLPVW